MRARGFTLVETMIAAVLLAVGLLAVAGTARASYRLAGLGSRLSRSADLLSTHAARLRAAGCGASSGSSTSGPFTVDWTVSPARGRRDVTILVRYDFDGRPQSIRASASHLCLAELP